MAATMVRRDELAHFLNVGGASEKWGQIGEGHANLSTSYNAENETTQYIHQKTGTTYLKNYAPSVSTSQVAHKGDEVFDYIDTLSWNLATGADAETDYLEVRLYNGTGGSYPARKFRVSISVGTEGDAATDPLSRDYEIGMKGDPVFGTFDPSSKTFTPEG